MNFFIENAWIIPLLPLWVFLIITFGTNLAIYENKKISSVLTVASTAIGLIFSIFLLIVSIKSPNFVYQQNISWLKAGNINLSVGYLIDNLSIMMLLVVTSVSMLIQIYSHEYMKEDEGYHRFFSYLALFNFSMLGLVLSTNLFQMYIFWELVGVSSYLLIGFWYKRPSAAKAAKKAFIMNRIGDFGFLLGILALLYFTIGFWSGNNLIFLGFTELGNAAEYLKSFISPEIIALIGFGLFMGTMAKSAQVPLHTWLPDAMEGPTPISALIHAATMVAAGVFLVARVYPILELSPFIMYFIMIIGAFTALIAATIAMVQFDIKRVLAYSTCSQLGYMVMAMGAGAYSAGLFHLMTHAYFKAMLFLCSGAVIHGLQDQQDMRYMGGLRKKMPVVSYAYLIGTLAISGLFLSGFWSKEEIFAGLAAKNYYVLLTLSLIIAGMTSFYMFRSYFMTFEGSYRGKAHPHNSNRTITLPLIILAIPSILIGFVLSGYLNNLGINSFNSYVSIEKHVAEHHNILLPIISIAVAFLGAFLSGICYWDKLKVNFNLKAFMEKRFKRTYKLFINKWYFDKLYSFLIDRFLLPGSALLSWFDKNIIDGIVNFIAYMASLKGKILCLLQNGNVQTYATVMFGGFTLIAVSILLFWLF